MMLTGRLGTSDLIVSQLGMGCVKLGSVGALHSGRSACRLVRNAVDAGVRFFDTADAYGSGISEAALGEALAPVREDVVVATKVGYLFKERGRLGQLTRERRGSQCAASARCCRGLGHKSAWQGRLIPSRTFQRRTCAPR